MTLLSVNPFAHLLPIGSAIAYYVRGDDGTGEPQPIATHPYFTREVAWVAAHEPRYARLTSGVHVAYPLQPGGELKGYGSPYNRAGHYKFTWANPQDEAQDLFPNFAARIKREDPNSSIYHFPRLFKSKVDEHYRQPTEFEKSHLGPVQRTLSGFLDKYLPRFDELLGELVGIRWDGVNYRFQGVHGREHLVKPFDGYRQEDDLVSSGRRSVDLSRLVPELIQVIITDRVFPLLSVPPDTIGEYQPWMEAPKPVTMRVPVEEERELTFDEILAQPMSRTFTPAEELGHLYAHIFGDGGHRQAELDQMTPAGKSPQRLLEAGKVLHQLHQDSQELKRLRGE